MVALEEIFDIQYGNSLNLNQLEKVNKGINFVSRTAKNNGVSAIVKQLKDEKLMSIGSITVSLGGSVLEAFVQDKPYYTGYHIYCLTEKEGIELTAQQKLYYCMSIRANKYRYSYGRQANRTLRTLLVPSIDEIPKWVEGYNVSRFDNALLSLSNNQIKLEPNYWREFKYNELFDIERGESFYLKNLESGNIPYVSASAQNNGISSKVSIYNQQDNAITLAYDGSIGEAFYQPKRFLASEKVVSMRLKKKWNKELNQYIALYLSTLIRLEKYRYNYGLKWSVNSRLLSSLIMLPIDLNGNPNWEYMENYIKTLPFSSSI